MQHDPLKAKKNLRSHYLQIRENLSTVSATEKSKQITSLLMNLPVFKSAETIHTYVSISEKKEVHTHDLIKTGIREKKKILVPKMQAAGELAHSTIASFDELKPNQWGVPEPENIMGSRYPEMDIIIVPMVAGDRKKNRLGYGKGYYDRFLEKVTALKIGLLYNCQLYPDILPTEEFDIPLDMLITESEIIE